MEGAEGADPEPRLPRDRWPGTSADGRQYLRQRRRERQDRMDESLAQPPHGRILAAWQDASEIAEVELAEAEETSTGLIDLGRLKVASLVAGDRDEEDRRAAQAGQPEQP